MVRPAVVIVRDRTFGHGVRDNECKASSTVTHRRSTNLQRHQRRVYVGNLWSTNKASVTAYEIARVFCSAEDIRRRDLVPSGCWY